MHSDFPIGGGPLLIHPESLDWKRQKMRSKGGRTAGLKGLKEEADKSM